MVQRVRDRCDFNGTAADRDSAASTTKREYTMRTGDDAPITEMALAEWATPWIVNQHKFDPIVST